jgi:2-iminobutanoate/2-iminopropanoate deaminase
MNAVPGGATKVVVDCPGVSPPPPAVSFSNALRIGERLVMSGMHAGDGAGGVAGDGSCLDQARISLGKIKTLVEAAGGVMDDVVLIRAYVTRIEDKVAVNRARSECFSPPYPCSTLVEVSRLVHPEVVVELEAEAIVGLTRSGEQRSGTSG